MSNKINNWHKALIIGLVLFQVASASAEKTPEKLSIERAIDMAQLNDPWLIVNNLHT